MQLAYNQTTVVGPKFEGNDRRFLSNLLFADRFKGNWLIENSLQIAERINLFSKYCFEVSNRENRKRNVARHRLQSSLTKKRSVILFYYSQ